MHNKTLAFLIFVVIIQIKFSFQESKIRRFQFDERNETLESIYEKYKKHFKKNYQKPECKKSFENRHSLIKNHNQKFLTGKETWKMGYNKFCDMTEEDYNRVFGYVPYLDDRDTFSNKNDDENTYDNDDYTKSNQNDKHDIYENGNRPNHHVHNSKTQAIKDKEKETSWRRISDSGDDQNDDKPGRDEERKPLWKRIYNRLLNWWKQIWNFLFNSGNKEDSNERSSKNRNKRDTLTEEIADSKFRKKQKNFYAPAQDNDYVNQSRNESRTRNKNGNDEKYDLHYQNSKISLEETVDDNVYTQDENNSSGGNEKLDYIYTQDEDDVSEENSEEPRQESRDKNEKVPVDKPSPYQNSKISVEKTDNDNVYTIDENNTSGGNEKLDYIYTQDEDDKSKENSEELRQESRDKNEKVPVNKPQVGNRKLQLDGDNVFSKVMPPVTKKSLKFKYNENPNPPPKPKGKKQFFKNNHKNDGVLNKAKPTTYEAENGDDISDNNNDHENDRPYEFGYGKNGDNVFNKVKPPTHTSTEYVYDGLDNGGDGSKENSDRSDGDNVFNKVKPPVTQKSSPKAKTNGHGTVGDNVLNNVMPLVAEKSTPKPKNKRLLHDGDNVFNKVRQPTYAKNNGGDRNDGDNVFNKVKPPTDGSNKNKHGGYRSDGDKVFNKVQPPRRQKRQVVFPKYKDWRSVGAVTKVMDQGNCEGCWSFSVVGTLESHYFLKHNRLYKFSSQQILDCARSPYSEGCNQGSMYAAFKYLQETGTTYEKYYPFVEADDKCYDDDIKKKIRIKTHYRLKNEDEILEVVATTGPVAVGIDARQLQLYETGIYQNPNCGTTVKQMNHAVIIVGYGTKNGVNYWICKNSWGTEWGERGFFKIVRGRNMCGIGILGRYPILD